MALAVFQINVFQNSVFQVGTTAGSFGVIRYCAKCKKTEVVDKYTPKCECDRTYRGTR